MDKVGILVVSKCLSAAAMVDAFKRSEKYDAELYVVEKQRNPFNAARAKVHSVSTKLSMSDIGNVAKRYREKISFGVTDTEDFVTSGGRDFVERETGIPMVCVSQKYAVERSKAEQRSLFTAVFPEANPSYKVFDPRDYSDSAAALSDFHRTASNMKGVVIKPDAPARGAGVGVWGNDFSTDGQMDSFFLSALSKGRVVVEEKLEGEESSFQAFSDGKHFHPAPLTRDYKRSLEGGGGHLTGGMGSYRGRHSWLPFLSEAAWSQLAAAEEAAFRRWRGKGSEPGLRGVVLYDAIMHTGTGFKVLERNSRGGNTELVNLVTTLQDDFIDVCFRTVDGTLKGLRFREEASVVICAVPQSYGIAGPTNAPSSPEVNLDSAYSLVSDSRGKLRVLPMDLKSDGARNLMGQSRTAAVVGIGDSTEAARKLSLAGVGRLSGPLRWRKDIASVEDIEKSARHLWTLRGEAAAA